MYTALVIVQVLIAIGLVTLILLQHGKGADAGAAFGAGASGTVFGARGASNFLSRATAWLATGFFVISLALAYVVQTAAPGGSSIVDKMGDAPEAATPAAPEAPAQPVIPE
ncbi:MAG: preprotein translocase subunit SecG [Polycyclovorans sp.]|jgi:preprotein translocase subunit SecG|nr:preprotein translocase subunit SecG [Pseudomonadota bacterium]|tara:strand:- start:1286 stop:1618 length:333 start_codon:yes stop_codon:yes gene_type:complete